MAEGKTPGFLKALFLERYNDFRNQLKRRLGSEDLAHDAMQEAFLKVNELPPGMPVQQPAAYLFRMALNAAEDHRRRDSRLLTGVEIGELINVADEASDPARIAQGRSEIEVFAGRCADCLSAPSRCCWPRACMNCRMRRSPGATVCRSASSPRKSSARWTTAAARAGDEQGGEPWP